jgi:hypothetical protein
MAAPPGARLLLLLLAAPGVLVDDAGREMKGIRKPSKEGCQAAGEGVRGTGASPVMMPLVMNTVMPVDLLLKSGFWVASPPPAMPGSFAFTAGTAPAVAVHKAKTSDAILIMEIVDGDTRLLALPWQMCLVAGVLLGVVQTACKYFATSPEGGM